MEEVWINLFNKINVRILFLQAMLISALFLANIVLFTPLLKAHSTLLEAIPSPNIVTEKTPEVVTLLFNEPVELDLANLIIYNWNAETVFIGQPDKTGERAPRVEFSIPSLEAGSYTIKWSVVSLDGHPVSGSYSFAIGQATAGTVKSIATANTSDGPLIIARTIAQGLVILLAGFYWFSSFAQRKGYPDINTLAPRGKSMVMLLILLATMAELVIYAISLPPGLIELVIKGRWDLLIQFPFILMVISQFVFLLLLLIPKMESVWYLAIWFILVCIPAFGGHVWGTEHPIIALIPRIVHQLSMALWIGGLFYVILVILYQKGLKKNILQEQFRQFFVKRMMIASGLIISSGVVLVFVQTSWSAVIFDWMNWSTLLLIKIILTIAVLNLALFQTLKWAKQGDFSTIKLIRIEWVIGLGIIFVGIWLSQVNYPIAIKAYEANLISEGFESIVKINQLKTGEQPILIDFLTDKTIKHVEINLSMPDHGMTSGPFTSAVSNNSVTIELPFTMSGIWKFEITAAFEGGDAVEWSDEIYVVGE